MQMNAKLFAGTSVMWIVRVLGGYWDEQCDQCWQDNITTRAFLLFEVWHNTLYKYYNCKNQINLCLFVVDVSLFHLVFKCLWSFCIYLLYLSDYLAFMASSVVILFAIWTIWSHFQSVYGRHVSHTDHLMPHKYYRAHSVNHPWCVPDSVL